MRAFYLASTALILALLSGQLAAEGYMGAGIGYSRFHDGGHLDDFDLRTQSVSGGMYGGYYFNSHLALEGTARWLGIYPSDISEQRFAALTAAVLGILPFGEAGFDGYLQAGVGAMLNSDAETPTAENPNNGTNADTSLAFLAGFGIRYTPPTNRQVTVRVGYEYYTFNMNYPVVVVDAEGNLSGNGNDNFRQRIDTVVISAQLNF